MVYRSTSIRGNGHKKEMDKVNDTFDLENYKLGSVSTGLSLNASFAGIWTTQGSLVTMVSSWLSSRRRCDSIPFQDLFSYSMTPRHFLHHHHRLPLYTPA